jgi:hypothetical protein
LGRGFEPRPPHYLRKCEYKVLHNGRREATVPDRSILVARSGGRRLRLMSTPVMPG